MSGVSRSARAWIAALRPRQWVKNLLVFAAPLAAGDLLDPRVIAASLVAFVSFVLASSATYLINDVVDADQDREHPEKRKRPVSSGAIGSRAAVTVAIVLGALALACGLLANVGLVAVVAMYLVISIAYSLRLKHEPVIELALLSAGFLLRAIAGGVAAQIYLSPWFLLVTGFGSLGIAAGKRYGELVVQEEAVAGGSVHLGATRRSLAGYTSTYLRFVWTLSAAVTVTTYCLWAVEVGQPSAALPWTLLSIIPFVLAVMRYGVDLDAGRTEAPEEVVLRDRALLALGLAWLVLFAAGTVGL